MSTTTHSDEKVPNATNLRAIASDSIDFDDCHGDLENWDVIQAETAIVADTLRQLVEVA